MGQSLTIAETQIPHPSTCILMRRGQIPTFLPWNLLLSHLECLCPCRDISCQPMPSEPVLQNPAQNTSLPGVLPCLTPSGSLLDVLLCCIQLGTQVFLGLLSVFFSFFQDRRFAGLIGSSNRDLALFSLVCSWLPLWPHKSIILFFLASRSYLVSIIMLFSGSISLGRVTLCLSPFPRRAKYGS